MAKNKNKKPEFIPKADNQPQDRHITIDYFHLYENLLRKEIDDWINARTARRDPFHPVTYYQQQLYKDALLDNHLAGAIDTQRILPVINKEFLVRDPKGNTDTVRSALIQGKWFRDILRQALLSIFYGYSLIFVDNLASPSRTILNVHRENVVPELGRILNNPLDLSGRHIDYRQFPAYFLYASLGSDTIGLIESVAPLTIYKRHSWASWDEFEQIFGLPIRIARTAINTREHKDDIQAWLETMGTAAYAILDKQTDIEIKESNHSDAYHIYLEKVNAANREISKRILGQTMTMEDGASLSQAQVHEKMLREVHNSDLTELTDWVNDTLFPVLRLHGFDIPEGYTFAAQDREVISPKEKIAIDQALLNAGYNLDPAYIEKFYGTPLDKDNPRRDTLLSFGQHDFFAPAEA